MSYSNLSLDTQIVVSLSHCILVLHTRLCTHTHTHTKRTQTHTFAIMTFTNIHIFNRYTEIVIIKEHFYAGDASLIELYNLF